MNLGKKWFFHHNYVMRIFLISLFLSLTADAGTVSRLYDFEPNTKAEADKVDAEFDNIISTVNGNINTDNLLDGGVATGDLGSNAVTTAKINSGAVTRAKMATSSSYYLKDFRKGCTLFFNATVTQSINVSTPCHLVIDGWVGEISATRSVGGLESGSVAANTVYYVYGAVNGSNDVDFTLSSSTPNTTTFRHPSTSSKRYIGSFLTEATASIAKFRQNGSRYYVQKDADDIFDHNFVTGSNYNVNAPPFIKALFADLTMDFSGATTTGSTCSPVFSDLDNILSGYVMDQITPVLGAGGAGEDKKQVQRIPVSQKTVRVPSMSCNFSGGPVFNFVRVRGFGWEEPDELY